MKLSVNFRDIAGRQRSPPKQCGVSHNPSRPVTGEVDMENDTCDCCERPMKYYRISPDYLYVCDDCRSWGMSQLGTTTTRLAVGIAVERDELPDCVWRGAEYPFCETY